MLISMIWPATVSYTHLDVYKRQVKSSARAGYDAARAAMGAGLDEVILINERGEVCDGSITCLLYTSRCV